jgi:hypothetical protein
MPRFGRISEPHGDLFEPRSLPTRRRAEGLRFHLWNRELPATEAAMV